jgi:hypothetical protein
MKSIVSNISELFLFSLDKLFHIRKICHNPTGEVDTLEFSEMQTFTRYLLETTMKNIIQD